MKIVKIVSVVVLMFVSFDVFSQDLIIMKNGDELETKVIEITNENIKYKKTSNLDGPIYSILISKVFMIKYENGEKDLFDLTTNETDKTTKLVKEPEQIKVDENGEDEKIANTSLNTQKDLSFRLNGFDVATKFYKGDYAVNRSEFIIDLKTNKGAYRMYRGGQVMNTIGSVIMYPSSFGLGWALGSWIADGYIDSPLVIMSSLGLAGGLTIHYIGIGQMKKSVRKYNSEKQMNLSLIYSNDGLGLNLNF